MSAFWTEALDEQQRQPQQRPVPPRNRPESVVAPPPGIEDFWEQAGKLIQGPEPAASFEERFGQSSGAEIRVNPSFAPGAAKTSVYHEDDFDRDRERRQMATAVQLATQAGAFGNERVKAAQDQAAQVTEMARNRTWTTVEDNTPRRVTDTRIAGSTTYQR